MTKGGPSSSLSSTVRETKRNLDQYRSPSMWAKLEKWKADKRRRQNDSKVKAQQPFKVGASKQMIRKVPCKASEKIKLLSESNQKTTWSYHTSPRHLNYRKSMGAGSKYRQTSQTRTTSHGKENLRQSVVKRSVKKHCKDQIRAPAVVGGNPHKSVGGYSSASVKEPVMKPARPATRGRPTLIDVKNVRKEATGNKHSQKRKMSLENEDGAELKSVLKVPRRAGNTTGNSGARESIKSKSKKIVRDEFKKKNPSGQGVGLKQGTVKMRRSLRISDAGQSGRNSLTLGGGTTQTILAATPRPNILMRNRDDARRENNTGRRSLSGHLQTNLKADDAAQTKRRQELEEWLIAKGKTPRRTASFLKTPQATSKKARRKTVGGCSDPYNSQLTVEEAMDACRNLLNEGCPAEYLSSWLEGLQQKLPCLTDMVSFMECQTEVQNKVQVRPCTETVTQEEQSVRDEEEDPAPLTKRRRRSSYQLLSPVGEDSSAVRYQVREATPYFKRIQEAIGNPTKTPSTMIVTPVRRSIRLLKRKSVTFASCHPESDSCIDALTDLEGLDSEHPVQLIIRPNCDLGGEFDLAEEEED